MKLLSEYGSAVPIAWYLAISAAITLVAVYFTRETNVLALETLDEADAKAVASEQDAALAGTK